jgi:iron complex transport system substrate-binding protein
MTLPTRLLALVLALLSALSFAQEASEPNPLTDARGQTLEPDTLDLSRVISLGGDLTEAVFALGQGERLVAVDTSSLYPPEGVAALPRVGYVRQLSAEGVLSLNPSLVIASEDAGPPEVLAQLSEAGVTLVTVPQEDSVAGAKAKLDFLAALFGVPERAETLKRQIDLDVLEAQLVIDAARAETKPKVMFIYARGAGALSVSGTGTSAHAMIELSGGENAVTEYEGYKPLTAEAAVAAAPDVLLFLSRGLESVGGVDGVGELPGLAQTPAWAARRVVALDDLYLLGFTPRVGQAVRDLTRALYPEVQLAGGGGGDR